MDHIAENVQKIREGIAAAALKSGRKPEDITLVGVTKTIGIGSVAHLLALGVNNLGENRAQELLAKYAAFESGQAQPGDVCPAAHPNWHFIGHLQTNKVKQVIGKVCLIQSVDSLHLAQEIDKCAEKKNCIVDILIELNIANEETKFGVKEAELYALLEKIIVMRNIRVKGLMTVAPNVEKSENNRIIFHKINQIYVDIRNRYNDNVKKDIGLLSMGMSNDYREAIEEGANMVRIGTGLFGGREN